MDKDVVERWLDAFAYRELHRTVDRLIGKAGYRQQDRSDLFHDLLAHLLSKLPAYDERRGHRYKFIKVVLDRGASKMLRHRRAKKRCQHGIRSLDSDPALNDAISQIGQRDHDRRRQRDTRDPYESAALVCDVKCVVATLPEDMQELSERLKSQNVTDVSRETEIPRSTVHDAVRQLRRRFERSDLQQYIRKRPTSGAATGYVNGRAK